MVSTNVAKETIDTAIVVKMPIAVVGPSGLPARDEVEASSPFLRDGADRNEQVPPATAVPAAPTAVPSTSGSAPSAASPCPTPTSLDRIDPGSVLGCPFANSIVTATDVATDEGFWATIAARQHVWVHLVGPGESPIEIEVGQQLHIEGVIAVPHRDPTRMGLPAEGDPRATNQDFYLEVRYADVRPAG